MKSKLLPAIILFAFLFITCTNTTFAAILGLKPQGACPNDNQVETALGCISTSAEPGSDSFFEALIQISVGVGGGLALLLMLYGVFIVTTSAGIPDKLKEGSEIITSAVTGLIFIILSVFLLNLIGINILGLPGLS
jgi:hypothetical protein